MKRVTAALAALALTIGVAAWWLWPMHVTERALAAATLSPPPEPALAPASAPAADGAPSTVAEVNCPHERITLAFDGQARSTACVGPARVMQSGSLRRHVFPSEGGGQGWSLELGVSDGHVVTAAITGPARLRYGCGAGACTGFAIGAPDVYGVRHFELNEARLFFAARAADGGADSVVRVTALLRIEPQAARPCATTEIDVVDGGGTSSAFCADGGAGFELTDDGRYRYRFDSLEGQTLSVTLDSAGNVRAARFGSRNCTAGGCNGLVSAGAGAIGDEHEARSFSFASVRLLGTDGTPVTLNGRLVVPAQH